METIDLDMNDVFDDGDGGNEDYGAAPVQLDDDDAPMQMEGDVEATQGEGDVDVLERLRDLSKGAAKKRVMKPQPKLDAERLKGNRGLAVLPKLFADVKFKDEKGYEAANLKLMMGKLEHWAHRLFPKLPFDDFIERMEKLGSKSGVQNCVKRIRLDMPVLDEDYVQQYEDDGDENEAPQDAVAAVQEEDDDMDAEEAFDEMIRQERKMQQQKANTSSGGMNGHLSDDEDELVAPAQTSPKKVPSPPVTPSQEKKELSADVRERMERNKRLAMEKRMKRMGLTPNKTNAVNLSSGDIAASPSQESRNMSAITSHNENEVGTKSKEIIDGPQDTELASGQLLMSESEPKENSEADLKLQMTEGSCTNNQDSDLHLKLSASQPGNSSEQGAETDETLDLHLTESVLDSVQPAESSMNLKLTETPSEQSKNNESDLNLQLTETENTDSNIANDVELDTDSNSKCDTITDGQKVEGSSNTVDEDMTERKGSEDSNSDQLDLKLSLSDSETMPMDTSLEDSVIS